MKKIPRALAALAGLSLCVSAAWAQTPVPTPVEAATEALVAAKKAVRSASAELDDLEGKLEKAKTAMRAADRALADENLNDVEQLDRKRVVAMEARKTFQITTSAKDDAQTALDKASDALYKVAAILIECKRAPAFCGGADGLVLTAADVKTIEALADTIKKAQEKAEKVGAASADASKLAAKAEAKVRDRVAEHYTKGSTDPIDEDAVKRAKAAVTETKKLADGVEKVNGRIKESNASIVAWAACRTGQACPGFSVARLTALKAQADTLDIDLEVINDGIKIARGYGYYLDDRVTSVHPNDQKKLVDLLVLLDEVPDAKSLFGSADAARVSASANGAEATIRIDLNRIPGALTRDSRLIFSAPKAKDGRGRLLGLTDADDVLPSVQWARDLTRDTQKFGPWLGEALYVFGVNAKLSYSDHAYRDRTQLGTEITEHHTPLSLGMQLGVAGTEAKKFHLIRANYAEFYKNADVETVCPATPAVGETWLTCVDASFGKPERQRGWVFGYEYRMTGKHFAASLGFEYDRRTNRKTYSLPIYLLRDTEDKDKPFTGGISLDYKTRSTLQPKRSFEFGVFVGAPFSLFSR